MAQGRCVACKTLYQNEGLLIAGYCKMCAGTQIPLLQAELARHRWIPVTEKLPELTADNVQSPWLYLTDGRSVEIAYYYDYTKREAKPGYATGKGWYGDAGLRGEPTHWMLIILPKEQ